MAGRPTTSGQPMGPAWPPQRTPRRTGRIVGVSADRTYARPARLVQDRGSRSKWALDARSRRQPWTLLSLLLGRGVGPPGATAATAVMPKREASLPSEDQPQATPA